MRQNVAPEHLALLKQGVEPWNKWRQESELDARLTRVELMGADLTYARLDRADLRGVTLYKANLTGAKLIEADLSYAILARAKLGSADLSNANLCAADAQAADLTDADLTDADLGNADFSYTNLTRVNFTRANLTFTNLIGSNVREANFNESVFGSTILAELDLSEAKSLETIRHNGPSVIDIATMFRSEREIPKTFLKGAGIPDAFITYLESFVGSAVEFYSCFISYSSRDQGFADRLYGDLQARGVRCWFAPHDVQGGRKLYEQIDEAIRFYDKILLILSSHSMASEWVKTEISKARRREIRDKARVLFPISLAPFEAIQEWECFDTDTGKDSAREIREYFIPDFSNWKDHHGYQNAFERLMRDLKSTAQTTAASV